MMLSSFVFLFAVHVAWNNAQYDPRNITSGTIMFEWDYLDQPYCVIIPNNTLPYNQSNMNIMNGNWVCVITGSPSKEGGAGERVLSLYSSDNGKTWSKPIEIEPNTSLTNAYSTIAINQYGRIYAIYNFNKNNVSTLPNGKPLTRVDEIGFFAIKYSDDSGMTFSENRYIIPYRNTYIDQHNSFNGTTDIMWCVDQTKLYNNNNIIWGFTKIGVYPQNPPESLWVINSPNLWTEMNVNNIKFNLYPSGNYGIQPIHNNITYVAEEAHIIPLSDNKGFQMIFRSNEGYLGCSYTNNGNINVNNTKWTESIYCQYANMFNSKYTKYVQNPRGPITPKRVISNNYNQNIMYLMLYYNNGATDYSHRNPYWLTSGSEIYNKNMNVTQILWSQPEIVLFSVNQNNERPGYPDIIQYIDDETDTIQVLFTETNKSIARLHHIPDNIIKGLLTQFSSIINPSTFNVSLIFNGINQSTINNVYNLIPSFDINTPYKMDLGFSVYMSLENHNESNYGDILLEYMQQNTGIKIVVIHNFQIQIQLFDTNGHNFTFNTDTDCTQYLLNTEYAQHIFGFIVDGNSRILTIFIDGYLCQGWTWLPNTLKSMNNNQNQLIVAPKYSGKILQSYWFNRTLLTSNLVSFYRYQKQEQFFL